MKRTNKLFKLFIPLLLLSTLLATVFSSLALCKTFYEDTSNINMKSPYAIFFVIFVLIALVLPAVFAILFKDLKITRTKRDLPIIKLAASILLVSVIAFEVYDMIFMGKIGFEIWRFFRLLISFLLLLHLVFSILPAKANIPPFAKYCANASMTIFCILSILSIYFYGGATPIPEYFKILFIMAYSFLTIFFLYDFKWKIMVTNPRAYVAIASMAFVFPAVVSITSLIGIIARSDIFPQSTVVISVFEMVLLLAFSFVCLAKVFAFKITVNHVIKASEEHQAKKEQAENK